jgi:hypothetical protein
MCGPWSNASDASLWCTGSWTNSGYDVHSRSGNNITFARGGFQVGFAPQASCTGSFHLEGIIEALDAPEEFYHDSNSGMLYFFPNTTNADGGSALPTEVVAVMEEALIRVVGTQRTPVEL